MGRRIVLSSLAARYHVKDGWTLDVLNKYLKSGSWAEMDFYPEEDSTYYILEAGGEIDVDQLLQDFPEVKVIPFGYDEKNLSSKELLESRNW